MSGLTNRMAYDCVRGGGGGREKGWVEAGKGNVVYPFPTGDVGVRGVFNTEIQGLGAEMSGGKELVSSKDWTTASTR